jgi:hypothetical protein
MCETPSTLNLLLPRFSEVHHTVANFFGNDASMKYRCHCPPPFTNVTPQWWGAGAEPQRSVAPERRPIDPGVRNRTCMQQGSRSAARICASSASAVPTDEKRYGKKDDAWPGNAPGRSLIIALRRESTLRTKRTIGPLQPNGRLGSDLLGIAQTQSWTGDEPPLAEDIRSSINSGGPQDRVRC